MNIHVVHFSVMLCFQASNSATGYYIKCKYTLEHFGALKIIGLKKGCKDPPKVSYKIENSETRLR